MAAKSYPYIPNSVAEIQEEMLRFIGVGSIEDLIADIAQALDQI